MIQLLSTDFDGTLVDSSCESDFQECPNALSIELEKASYAGVQWLINSGRPLEQLLDRLENFNSPVRPHFLVTNERHLYRIEKDGKINEFLEWNHQCDSIHQELFKICGNFFEIIRKLLLSYGNKVTILENSYGYLESIIATEEKIIDEIELKLLRDQLLPKELSFQRSAIFLRFTHHYYNKGSTLKELSRALHLKPKDILAIGDHHNDAAMLSYELAEMLACPFNAHEKIKKIVSSFCGYISTSSYGEGTAEAINFYKNYHS